MSEVSLPRPEWDAGVSSAPLAAEDLGSPARGNLVWISVSPTRQAQLIRDSGDSFQLLRKRKTDKVSARASVSHRDRFFVPWTPMSEITHENAGNKLSSQGCLLFLLNFWAILVAVLFPASPLKLNFLFLRNFINWKKQNVSGFCQQSGHHLVCLVFQCFSVDEFWQVPTVWSLI